MKNRTKYFICAGVLMCGIGLGLMGVGSLLGGREYVKEADLNEMSGAAMQADSRGSSMSKTKIEEFCNLKVDLGNIDFVVEPSGDDHYYLAYDLDENCQQNSFTSEQKGDTLLLQESADVEFSSGLNIDIRFLSYLFGNKEALGEQNIVRLYVPEKNQLEDCSIQVTDGDISLQGIHADNMEINQSYGDLDLIDAELNQGSIQIKDGELSAANILIGKTVDIQNTYGTIDIKLNPDCSDAISISAETEYGEIGVSHQLGGKVTVEENDGEKQYYDKVGSEHTKSLRVQTKDGDIILK